MPRVINGMTRPMGSGALSQGFQPGSFQPGKYYTMATNEDGEAEITMYGDIVQEIPRDWWTDEPIEGMFITLEGFLDDLKKLDGAKSITIRVHSLGGDAYAAITIHNRLRELAKKSKLIARVDGVAMSGGSLIISAADTVIVNASSIIMIHSCWCFMFGGYNSAELRKVADSNDAVDKAQASIYTRKTGMSTQEILDMMAAVTYMTGTEAVEKGFANEVLDGDKLDIAASSDRRTLYVGGRTIPLMKGFEVPASMKIPTISSANAQAGAEGIFPFIGNQPNQAASPKRSGAEDQTKPEGSGDKNNEGGISMTPEDTKVPAVQTESQVPAAPAAAAPAATPAADPAKAAIEAERKRQQEIDEIAPVVGDADMIREAKYGENPCTAAELALNAMKKQAQQGAKHLVDAKDDYAASGAAGVKATPTGGDADPKADVNAAVDAGVEAAKKARNGGK